MTTRPTDPVPDWATDLIGPPPAVRAVPTASKRLLGWIFQDPPPFGFVNWFWGVTGDWLLHLSTSSSKFLTLHDAANTLAIGDTAIVDEHDGANFPGEDLITVALGAASSELAVSGRSVAYNDGAGSIKLVDRNDLTTDVNAAAFAPTIAFTRVITDGKFVIIAGTGGVEAFDHDLGGAPLWTHVFGATVNDIAMDGTHVYLVGDAAAGPIHARALLLSTGATVWSYNHGANLEAVDTTGRQVFVAGAAGNGGATMRALDAANGFDFANLGGTGLSATDMAWDVIDANGPTVRGQLAADRRGLLVVGMSAGVNRIQIRDSTTGASIRFLDNPSSAQVEVDQRFVYGIDPAISTLARLICWDKYTGARVWVSDGDKDYNAVRSDGAGIFASAGSPVEVSKLARGNRARLWRRVDPADDYLPARQLIVPED